VVVVVDDGGDVVVSVDDEVDGGVTITVLDLPESPLSPFGPSGPGAPGGPGTGTVDEVDGGVFTTAGGFVTTVGRSQAINPIDANNVANNNELFISLSIRVNRLLNFQFLREPPIDARLNQPIAMVEATRCS